MPHGGTVLQTGDLLVMAARAFEDRGEPLSSGGGGGSEPQVVRALTQRDLGAPKPPDRDDQTGLDTIIPDGSTRLEAGDVLVAAQSNTAASA